MCQGDLYFEEGLSDQDLEHEDMSYVGEITSLVPSHEMPKEDWQGNYETLLNGKVYLSIDGTLHLLLSNGRQIEMTRHATGAPVTTDSPEAADDTMSTGKTLSEGQTRPDLAIRQEAEKDGLLLQVEADYAFKFTEEPFTLTATITNTSGHDITYGAGSGTRNVHQEIQVHIRGKNDAEFTDMDIYGKIMTADMKLDTLKAGETFTETIRFLPGAPRSDSEIDLQDIDWFPAGEYKGTAEFMYFTGTMKNPGEQKKLQLEFSVILFN
jgi:hypothetical protein